MKIIQKLADMISEEITDAHKYARCYEEYKDFEPELSRMFSTLANEELNHAAIIHTQVVRIIKKYREEQGEPPAHMQTIYDYLHQRNIDKANEVRLMLS